MRGPKIKDTFEIKCSRDVFSEEELDILETYGIQLQRLANGERVPITGAQRRFIEVSRGRRQPETLYEKTWAKYNARVAWEAVPSNKVAMGERRKMPDDRGDWKKMRGRAWSDAQKRARGFDE